ncbi:hypothetical protein [Solemya velum gill symbiont]|uniref:hypothetical protein n=1 Tax=Solemya velum gill symbiont TaxID=2340 RepID=UPI000998AD89|nr:hypothetical protein [Solemya velum gill symbiont]
MASLQSSLNQGFIRAMDLPEVLGIQSSAIVGKIEINPSIAVLLIGIVVSFSKHKDINLVQLALDIFGE